MMNSINCSELLSFGQITGWTLMHSLWQIAIVGLIVRSLLFFIPQKRSNTRYVVLTAGLLCCLSWSGYTFVELREVAAVNTAEAIRQSVRPETAPSELLQDAPWQQTSTSVIADASPTPTLSWWKKAGDNWQKLGIQLSPYMPALAVVWYAGVFLLTGFLLFGFFQMDRLRSRGVQLPDREWRARFRELSRQMGIRREVQFLLSDKVQEPITFYFFRPVVLAPVSLFTGLHPEQVETLLLHELAHIRRADFLVNIVQSMVEVLFFYHPVVWWISGKMREEREHCCDDLVLQIRNTPMLYAEALTHLQLFNHPSKTKLVMSANGIQGTLSKRIFRLFGRYDQQPSFTKGILCVVLGISLLAQAFILPGTSVSTERPQPQAATIIAGSPTEQAKVFMPTRLEQQPAAQEVTATDTIFRLIPLAANKEAEANSQFIQTIPQDMPVQDSAVADAGAPSTGQLPDYVHTYMLRSPVAEELQVRLGASQDLKEVEFCLATEDGQCKYFKSWEALPKGTHQLIWDIRHLPSGTYFMTTTIDGQSVNETVTVDHESARKTYPPGDPRADQGCSDLLRAVKAGDVAKVGDLLKAVDPNCNFRDDGEPRSPLVAAARMGHLEIGKMLVAAEANVEYHDHGDETPLMAAARYGHLDFVKYLLEQKAQVNAQLDGDGTALICAVKGNHYDVAKLLLENGADPFQVSPGDEYAMYHARMEGNKQMIKLLKEYERER
jgi:beta-lactamase regulating signal transducer with metallopeptidase domain